MTNSSLGYQPMTTRGTSGNDTLQGTGAEEYLYGKAGDDLLISGGGPRDHLHGGDGNDTLMGGAQTEHLSGGDGNDYIQSIWADYADGGEGNDTISGGGDYMVGGRGDDLLIGDDGARQHLHGQEGNDTLIGGAHNEHLSGGKGDDHIQSLWTDFADGGAGNDTISGGAEYATGGGGDDWIDCDAIMLVRGNGGHDSFAFASTGGTGTVQDFNAAADTLNFVQSGLPVGNADLVVDGAVEIASPGGHAASAELVLASGHFSEDITAVAAAAMIGSADDDYQAGQTALFAVNNGFYTAVYLFTSSDADAAVSADELSLVGNIQGTRTYIDDYAFSA